QLTRSPAVPGAAGRCHAGDLALDAPQRAVALRAVREHHPRIGRVRGEEREVEIDGKAPCRAEDEFAECRPALEDQYPIEATRASEVFEHIFLRHVEQGDLTVAAVGLGVPAEEAFGDHGAPIWPVSYTRQRGENTPTVSRGPV